MSMFDDFDASIQSDEIPSDVEWEYLSEDFLLRDNDYREEMGLDDWQVDFPAVD
jgi:hypothetical protein